MKPYKPLFNKQIKLYEWTRKDEYVYESFRGYMIQSNYGELLLEWKLFPELKAKIDFIKKLAIETGFKIKDLFKLFMDKGVFKFFSLIGWSFQQLFDILKKGYKVYKDFIQAVYDYIEKNKVVEWTKDHLMKLDLFLQKHPKTKRIAGIVLASLLVYMWLTMTFVGNPSFDFDLSTIFQSFMGKMSIADIFGGANGTVFLSLFMTGLIFNLSFPYPGTNLVKFAIGVITTIAKKLKTKLRKGKENEKQIEKDIEDVT